MDLQLEGKRALVTGSTAGIGMATAAALYREGASVVLNGRSPQRVEAAIDRIMAPATKGKDMRFMPSQRRRRGRFPCPITPSSG